VQKSLFSHDVLDEEKLEQMLAPLYPPFWRMLREPFDDLAARRASDRAFRILDEGECAQWLRPQIMDCARREFSGSEVLVEKRRQQVYLNVGGLLAVTPKKFRRNAKKPGLTFSAYGTPQNLKYWQQQSIDGLPMLPRIIIGYQFIAEMTDIRIWIAYPHGRTLRECYLMPDQSGVVVGQFAAAAHEQPDEDRGFEVKPKKDSRKLG